MQKNLLGIHQQMNILKEILLKCQISISATAARGPVFVSTVVSYSLAYDAIGVMDNDSLATALESQIQISIGLIGMVRKPSIEPIVLAKRWGITPEKDQKTIQAMTQKGIRTIFHSSLSRQFIMNDVTFVIIAWNILCFPTQCLPPQHPEGATDVHKYMPQTLDGLGPSQWHQEVMHMRPHCCCL